MDLSVIFSGASPIVFAILLGVGGILFLYIRNAFKSADKDEEVKIETAELPRKKKTTESSTGVPSKAAKKKHQEKWNQDSNKQRFTHGWLLTSLKGHSTRVLDMDFSSNGKFLATCAEDTTDDLDPGGEPGDSEQCSGNSSGSEGNKENSPEPGADGAKGSGLSRRQKRNRVRRDDDAPSQRAKKTKAKNRRDRAVILWSTKDWDHKDHKSLRFNIQFDHAKFVRWSPDSKAFIIQRASDNCSEVYKVSKKPDGWISGVTKAMTFSKRHEDELVGLGIACNGKFIMTCSEKTDLTLWSLKGQQLAKLDTLLMSTYRARITPCGRFVVAAGFAPEVRVWEVGFNKAGDFHHVTKVFELTGHSAGVYDVGFSSDSSRMATVSKDGTWKVFNTKIEYQQGEDPHLLVSGKYNAKASTEPAHLSMSPNGEVIAIAKGSTLSLFSVLTGECDKTINDIYSGPISCVQFDSLGKFVLTAGDSHVRVFHNVTGYRTAIASLKASLKPSLSKAQQERMQGQIQEAQEFLKAIGEAE